MVIAMRVHHVEHGPVHKDSRALSVGHASLIPSSWKSSPNFRDAPRRRVLFELIHGDCAKILRTMRHKSVDCIFTDPPYIIGTAGRALEGRKYLEEISARSLDAGFDPALLDEFLRILKTPNLFIFCSRLQLRDRSEERR